MNQKTFEIVCRLPHDGTDTVTNLREEAGELVPVGEPATVCDGVAGAWPLGNGVYLCVDSSRRVLTVCGAGVSACRCGTLKSELTGVVAGGEGRWWLLTADGPQLLVSGDGGVYYLSGPLPDFGAVRLWGEGGSQFAETVRLSPLSGGYVRGSGALTEVDSLSVGADLREAYRRMKMRAALAGQRLQPSIMAWQLVDDAGQVIFRSVPQWVGAGFQLADPIETGVGAGSDGKFSEVDTFIIKADGWRPAVEVDAAALSEYWKDHTERLELIAAPAMEFIDRDNGASGRLDATASGHASLRLFMPGASSGMTTDTAGLMELTVSALARFYDEASVVATLARPFASAGRHTLGFGGATARKLTVDNVPAGLQLPHRFMAATVFESGSATFMADLTVLPAVGPQAVDIAAGVGIAAQASVHQVALTLSDGSVRVGNRLCAAMPEILPPLIVFPEPDAVAATLTAGTETMSLTLTASPCGRYAYWISASLRPVAWTPAATGNQPVSQASSPRRLGGTLLCARSGSPLTPLSAHRVCSGIIRRITPAVGSSGGWNYGRQHLTLWGTEGIYALSVDRSLLTVGCSLLHRSGVDRADAVAVTADSCRAALSSGCLLTISGARARCLDIPMTPVAAGWCGARRELWLAAADGSVAVLTASGGFYRREPIKITGFCSNDDGLLHALTTDGRLIDCSAEMPPIGIPVAWSATVQRSVWPMAMAEWHLDAASADITLALHAGNGGASTLLSALSVAGQINAPLVARVYSPRRHFLTARIAGTLTAPARLRRLTLSPQLRL
ncbi:MAG: hypothetical protein K2H33_04475 [Muribaculaceae bacterium]|nr:hypothetical protein [Muribaculaceae bacterium]